MNTHPLIALSRQTIVGFFIVSVLLVLPLQALQAQTDTTAVQKDTTWTKGGGFRLNLAYVSLSNWAGGGESTLSGGTELSLFANMETERATWDNSLEFAYGIIQEGRGSDAPIKKNNDLLIITSKYGRKLNKKWSLAGLLDFRTQVAPGYIYEFNEMTGREERTFTSEFLAPGYLLVSTGVSYKPSKNFSAGLLPMAGKFTFVLNDSLSQAGAYGVEAGEQARAQLGASLIAKGQWTPMENVEVKGNLLLFADYDKLANIDVNLEIFVRLRVNKWISTTFTSQLIYDDDIDVLRDDDTIGPALQVRNVLNLGFTFDF